MYSNHKSQLKKALPPKNRIIDLEHALKDAFKGHITERPVAYILFDEVSVKELADAFFRFPVLIKSVLASINVASRAIARDLGINVDTYKHNITEENANFIAGYIKPMLPKEVAIPSLLELDRYFWTDKEMRANKGNWEKKINFQLNSLSTESFKKRKFELRGEQFEIDAAHPDTGLPIKVGVDIKRIESPRDIHKRADEIVNKAAKFKDAFPDSYFFAVIYYPFPSEHSNVKSRLESDCINGVYFAGEKESSIVSAIKYLLGQVGLLA